MQIGFTDHVEIRPGTLAQVHESRTGRRVAVSDDVQGVAQQLREISDELRLVFMPEQALWAVEQHVPLPDGSVRETLVTTALDLDGRVLQRCREVCSPSYDLGAEIEKAEARADKAHLDRRAELLGDAAEKMGHALRQDLSRHEAPYTRKSRAFIHGAFKPREG